MVLSFLLPVTAQTVSEEEILSISDQTGDILFENYVGPVTVFNTREEITGIGLFLGTRSSESPSWGNKYQLYHSYQPEIPEGLDGDILVLLPDAGVDHIRNLRMILSGYLQGVYSYEQKRADVLAEFITYYNAIYYKNLTHFTSRYKEGVLQYLSAQNAGLSTHFSEWAGKSRIVIPVKSDRALQEDQEAQPGLDTSIISQPEVVEEMRKEEDKALDTRKEMVEIREEELDQQQEVLDRKQDELQQEENAVDEQIREQQEIIASAEEDSPEAQEAQEELKTLEEEKEVIQEEKEVLEEKQEEIRKEQEEVFEMREDIAEDENTLNRQEDVIPSAGLIASSDTKALWFIKIDESGTPSSFGRLCKIAENGEILQESPLNSIRGNSIIDSGENIVVIAGNEGANTSVKPVLIDKETLEVAKQGDLAVYAGNRIWTDDRNLFIITRNNSDWVLGKYTYDLVLQETSEIRIHPDTPILFDGDSVLIQNANGDISVLSVQDLSEIQ